MAAKPPKPPGNFLKSLLSQHSNNKNQQELPQQTHSQDGDTKEEDNSKKQPLITATNSADSNTTTIPIVPTNNSNCNCSNISIMHLFHEMKQEFPTIPDSIVAQCVNENCHRRKNCVQMLKNELELNPVPVQSYPTNVLHPPSNNNNLQNSTTVNTAITTTSNACLQKPALQQKPLQKPPLKPIRPIRTAPLHIPSQPYTYNNNCSKVTTLTKNTSETTTKPVATKDLGNKEDVICESGECLAVSRNRAAKITPHYKQSISTRTGSNLNVNLTPFEVSNDDEVRVNGDKNGVGGGTGESRERTIPRQRPTTLNLNTQQQRQQQQQRQRLNIQLQQCFQEKHSSHQQEQPQRQHQPQNPQILTKPIRKAPLPPIATKPSHFQSNLNAVNTFLNDTHLNNQTTAFPASESEISLSVSLSTPSPTSSSSSNTTTHHACNKPTQAEMPTTINQIHLQTKSPIRHRSVINLQPELPYSRDFLFTPVSVSYASATPSSPSLAAPPSGTKQTIATHSSSFATSSPTASVAGSQKSFTSVNLTLRPPVSPKDPNSALQPSTIDITAGPGFSGASGGGKSLHYSSTSYDARLGYQQNFQITVTDECGVFNASRVLPHQQQQRHMNQQFHNNNVVAFQQNIQNSIQSPQAVGSVNTPTDSISGLTTRKMCYPPQQTMDAPNQETMQRQKKKRDKLAAALREYKRRLGNVEQEINLLTGTIPTEGLSERLDEEITKLRRDCQDMLRSSSTFTQAPSQQELAINHQPQQQQPQPFPRQKAARPPPRPPPPRQTSVDIIQHHSHTSTPLTAPAPSLPNLNVHNSTQQLQQSHANLSLTLPSYHQRSETFNANFGNNNPLYTDHHSNYSDRDQIEDAVEHYDEYEEAIEPWECNMCTFRNHPQLNICETCENMRIIPGRRKNLSRALTAANNTNNAGAAADSAAASSTLGLLRASGSKDAANNSSIGKNLNAANGNLEHDSSLVQQQLQHLALHS